MARASFETVDGEDVDINSTEVIQLHPGEEEGTTLVELEDGSEITVIGTQVEVAAELELDPLDFLDPDDDVASLDELDDEDEEDDPLDEE